MSPAQFERLVTEALALIPAEFRRRLDNVTIVIEDEPSAEVRAEMGLGEEETLFGLYTGTPLTERTVDYAGLPDQITIYRRPILEEFDSPAEVRREVARTVIHEIAHHFGIGEERLKELGWD
jgi:predicted Zn-dependent protease with MMP-like domain